MRLKAYILESLGEIWRHKKPPSRTEEGLSMGLFGIIRRDENNQTKLI
jgi:hypothetical protein